jgi:hypothetical protein
VQDAAAAQCSHHMSNACRQNDEQAPVGANTWQAEALLCAQAAHRPEEMRLSACRLCAAALDCLFGSSMIVTNGTTLKWGWAYVAARAAYPVLVSLPWSHTYAAVSEFMCWQCAQPN